MLERLESIVNWNLKKAIIPGFVSLSILGGSALPLFAENAKDLDNYMQKLREGSNIVSTQKGFQIKVNDKWQEDVFYKSVEAASAARKALENKSNSPATPSPPLNVTTSTETPKGYDVSLSTPTAPIMENLPNTEEELIQDRRENYLEPLKTRVSEYLKGADHKGAQKFMALEQKKIDNIEGLIGRLITKESNEFFGVEKSSDTKQLSVISYELARLNDVISADKTNSDGARKDIKEFELKYNKTVSNQILSNLKTAKSTHTELTDLVDSCKIKSSNTLSIGDDKWCGLMEGEAKEFYGRIETEEKGIEKLNEVFKSKDYIAARKAFKEDTITDLKVSRGILAQLKSFYDDAKKLSDNVYSTKDKNHAEALNTVLKQREITIKETEDTFREVQRTYAVGPTKDKPKEVSPKEPKKEKESPTTSNSKRWSFGLAASYLGKETPLTKFLSVGRMVTDYFGVTAMIGSSTASEYNVPETLESKETKSGLIFDTINETYIESRKSVPIAGGLGVNIPLGKHFRINIDGIVANVNSEINQRDVLSAYNGATKLKEVSFQSHRTEKVTKGYGAISFGGKYKSVQMDVGVTNEKRGFVRFGIRK